MPLDPLSRAILKWCAVLAAVCVLGLVVYHRGGANEREAHKATKQAHALVLGALAEKAKAAADRARAASEAVKRGRAEADARLQERTDEANRLRGDLAAALRRGDVRLQDRWACPVPGAGEGGTPSNGGAPDPEGRYDSAGRIVADADHDAAVIDWLWASWLADRKAVIDGGCAVSP